MVNALNNVNEVKNEFLMSTFLSSASIKPNKTLDELIPKMITDSSQLMDSAEISNEAKELSKGEKPPAEAKNQENYAVLRAAINKQTPPKIEPALSKDLIVNLINIL